MWILGEREREMWILGEREREMLTVQDATNRRRIRNTGHHNCPHGRLQKLKRQRRDVVSF